jgi:hypothetical protein
MPDEDDDLQESVADEGTSSASLHDDIEGVVSESEKERFKVATDDEDFISTTSDYQECLSTLVGDNEEFQTASEAQ